MQMQYREYAGTGVWRYQDGSEVPPEVHVPDDQTFTVWMQHDEEGVIQFEARRDGLTESVILDVARDMVKTNISIMHIMVRRNDSSDWALVGRGEPIWAVED